MCVLILGASSRIATCIAHRYADKGMDVALADLREDLIEPLAADLKVRYGVRCSTHAFDAVDYDSHPALVEQVESACGPVEVALVAFGWMGDQGESEQDFAKAKRVLDINYTGAASASEAVAAKMVERGQGQIIGISSVAGDRGRQSNYFYGSAKGAFRLYLQGLRSRLYDQGVQVLTVRLGPTDTRMTFAMEDRGLPLATPEKVAKAIVRAADKGVDDLYYPPMWRGIMMVIDHLPESIFKRFSF